MYLTQYNIYFLLFFILLPIPEILIRRYYEYQADIYAVKKGYSLPLIKCLRKIIELNKKYGTSPSLTSRGNDVLDIYHPFLTTRISYIENYAGKLELS